MNERRENAVDAFEHEIAEEKAEALGRSGRKLEQALEMLRAHEQSRARGEPEAAAVRERLLWDLAESVESFVVQREACGLRDARHALELYDVPEEALVRVGVKRP